MQTGEPIEILLVEDNPGDVDLTIEALEEGRVRNNLSVASDGTAAMKFLRQEGEFAGCPRPDLILLDLNLPGRSGHEVLLEIKSDEDLRRIPVVVLTSSAEEVDVLQAYNQYANAYITKPVGLSEFMTVVQSIEQFWLTIVKLPT